MKHRLFNKFLKSYLFFILIAAGITVSSITMQDSSPIILHLNMKELSVDS